MKNEKKKTIKFIVRDNEAGDIARVLTEINEAHEKLGIATAPRAAIVKQALALYRDHLKKQITA
jgi:ArsR family metal-binding transcriptional regulator